MTLEQTSGVEVAGFDERGPAATAGLRVGDIVVGIDGHAVTGVDDLHRALSKWPIVAPITLRVVRGLETILDVSVMPVEAPS
jgi:S1-C subfamily serine protease